MSNKKSNNPTVIISAGGSGGHVIPAQALAQELQDEGIKVIFAAEHVTTNTFLFQKNFDCIDIPAAPVALLSLKKIAIFLYFLFIGMYKGIRLLYKVRPCCVVGFGSYHTVSMLFSAVVTRTPLILHEANAHPGRVTRLFAPFAKWVGCYFIAAKKRLHIEKRKIQLVDIPLRKDIKKRSNDVFFKHALMYYGFTPSLPTILIIGGSQGANIFNLLLPSALEMLAQQYSQTHPGPVLQVIHCAGSIAAETALKARYSQLKQSIMSHITSFEAHIEYAYQICDIVVARSGASTIAEIAHYNKKALFIPFAKAVDNHQVENAKAYLQRGTRGYMLEEKELCGTADPIFAILSQMLTAHQKNRIVCDQDNEEKTKKSFGCEVMKAVQSYTNVL